MPLLDTVLTYRAVWPQFSGKDLQQTVLAAVGHFGVWYQWLKQHVSKAAALSTQPALHCCSVWGTRLTAGASPPSEHSVGDSPPLRSRTSARASISRQKGIVARMLLPPAL